MTLDDLAEQTGISKPTLCQFERGRRMRTMIVAKLLAYYGQEAADAFPEGDPLDQVLPVSDFGSWLRNFRVRRGLGQAELARDLGVCKASISAYEMNQTRPKEVVLKRLRKAFKLDGDSTGSYESAANGEEDRRRLAASGAAADHFMVMLTLSAQKPGLAATAASPGMTRKLT